MNTDMYLSAEVNIFFENFFFLLYVNLATTKKKHHQIVFLLINLKARSEMKKIFVASYILAGYSRLLTTGAIQ